MKKTLNTALFVLTALMTTQSSFATTTQPLTPVIGKPGVNMRAVVTGEVQDGLRLAKEIREGDISEAAGAGAGVLNGFLTLAGQSDLQLNAQQVQQTGEAVEAFVEATRKKDVDGQIAAGVEMGTQCCFTLFDWIGKLIAKCKKKSTTAAPANVASVVPVTAPLGTPSK